jgi:hypothetical protein
MLAALPTLTLLVSLCVLLTTSCSECYFNRVAALVLHSVAVAVIVSAVVVPVAVARVWMSTSFFCFCITILQATKHMLQNCTVHSVALH